jgi:threonine efflux protein
MTWIAAITVPGPDTFLLLRLGIRARRAAVWAALGIMLGNILWITVSLLGVTALLSAVPWLLPALQLGGSTVLAWLGVQSIRAGLRSLRQKSTAQKLGEITRPFLLGLTTNVANPKALIFYTAVFSHFLPADADWAERGAIVAVMITTGVVWFVGFAFATSSGGFQRWFLRAAGWIDIVAGVVFLLVAIVMLTELALPLIERASDPSLATSQS